MITDDRRDQQQAPAAPAADDCRVLEFGVHNILQYGPHNTLRDAAGGSLYLMSGDFALIGEEADETGAIDAIDEMRHQWPSVVVVPAPPSED